VAGRDTHPEKLLGPLEAEVMQVIWAREEPVSVRAVLDQLNRRRDQKLAYTTVMTVMSRLEEKGILSRSRHGRGYVYVATVTDPAGIAVRGVMRDFGDAAVAHFVEEARADPRVLRRLERLLDEDR
jgi:predicted transcriptional regulator